MAAEGPSASAERQSSPRGRSERFTRAPGRAGLPATLAAHAARLTGGTRAAIRVADSAVAAPAILASTSREERWLATVRALDEASALANAAPDSEGGPLAVAAVGAPRSSGRRALIAVEKPAGEDFTDDDLRRLDDVALVVEAALEEILAGVGAPKGDVGPFHHRLPAAFERLEGLPALAESRDKLLASLGDSPPSPSAIAATIESDIALLIAVLRLANQAEARRRSTIWTVPEAVEALTPEGIETLARRITTFDFFQRIRGWAVPPERFRLHAVMTQRVAERLGRLVDHPHPDQLVVAALLHDIGKLVLIEAFPGYPERVHAGAETPEERLRAERRTLGLDHEVAGGVLLRRWRLPERLAEIVARHHTGTAQDDDAALIRLADELAHYAQGRTVSPRELHAAATTVGLTSEQLRTLMYELSRDSGTAPRSRDPSPLSERETQVLRELAKASTYQEISRAIGLSTSTVRTHLSNVYRKLDVADRAQAVLKATERGWI